MATVTGLTAERMLEIEAASVVSGAIVADHLILTRFDQTTIDAGALPAGPQGPTGPAGGQIPGEIKIWPGSSLPSVQDYGNWVWADGSVYVVATYPEAAANIATQWRTFGGASDPGVNNFRVPDLRGLVPAGLDQMPGGSRANRVSRSVAIIIAGRTGEETHIISIPEMPAHGHTVNDPGHFHSTSFSTNPSTPEQTPSTPIGQNIIGATRNSDSKSTGITINNSGSGTAHENMQPTVFVPYIVKLDD